MHRTFPQEPQFKRLTRERGRGHEATGEPSEGSSTEEEEESADRGTGESQHWLDVECLTVEMETDCSSLGRFYGPGNRVGEGENPKINPHVGNSVLKQDKTTQKALPSPLPSFFVAPIYREVTGSPSYRVTEVAGLAEQNNSCPPTPPRVVPKKKGNLTARESPCAIPKISERSSEPSKIARPTGLFLPGSLQARPRYSTSKSPPLPTPRAGSGIKTPPRRKPTGMSPLEVDAVPMIPPAKDGIEACGEVKEKLVYVVEEKGTGGKNVTKVETDLFTLNEILAIKKDLVELSEFAKKLKKLKQTNRELESGKSEDGLCQCEPSAQILREVNKRIEALEMRQEELEKVSESKFGIKRDAETGTQKAVEAKISLSSLPKSPEKPKPTDKSELKKESSPNPYDCFPKAELFVSRADSFSKASDIFNELLDIKSQLQKFEQNSPLKASPEEVSIEDPANPPERKNRPIAVFTSKTFILSPDNHAKKETEAKADDVNGLLKECSKKLEEIPAEAKDGQPEPKCKSCSRPLEEKVLENQEPQKNRATETDLKQADPAKKESSNGKQSNDPSSPPGECFASPSGRFFAWMKKSRGKLKGNVRPESQQPKVLHRTIPRHRLSWSTSSSSSLTEVYVEEPIRKTKRHKRKSRNSDPVLARVTRSRSADELDSGICKRDKSCRRERGKRGGMSPSKGKTHRDIYKVLKRREPRFARHARRVESTTSSSFSVFLDTFDFEETSTSADQITMHPHREWNERIVSCGGDNNARRKKRNAREEKMREEGMREAREKKIRKTKKAETRQSKRMPRQKKSDEGNKKHQKKVVISCGSASRNKDKNLKPERLLRQEHRPSPHPEPRDCFKTESKDSLGVYKKYNEEKQKSESSTEKPSDDRFSFKNFLKSFSWLYSRLGSVSFATEYHEDKKEECAEKPTKELRNERSDVSEDYEDDAESSRSSQTDGEEVYPRHRLRRSHHRQRDSNHINNCDCIKAYLETRMQRKLAALMLPQKSSGATTEVTSASESSNGDFAFARHQKAKGENQKDKRLQRRKKKHAKKSQQKHHRKHKHREGEPLCRKCRAYCTILDELEEKGEYSNEKIHLGKLNSISDNRCSKREDRNRSDYSSILAFLHQFCRSKHHSKGASVLPRKRGESKTCFILPEEAREDCREKSKRFWCNRCGRKLKRQFEGEPYDPDGDRMDGQVWDYDRKSASEESGHYENPSIGTPSLDDENERKYKNKRDIRHGCRHDKEEYWRRERRKRRKKKLKNKIWLDEERQRDLATDTLFLRDSLSNGMNKMTEPNIRKESSISLERLKRKNLRNRLSSIHYLWKNLRKCREKGKHPPRQRLGKKSRRSSSKLNLTFSDELCRNETEGRPSRPEERPSALKKKYGASKKAKRDGKEEKRRRRKEE